jgi:hypothetical protein
MPNNPSGLNPLDAVSSAVQLLVQSRRCVSFLRWASI